MADLEHLADTWDALDSAAQRVTVALPFTMTEDVKRLDDARLTMRVVMQQFLMKPDSIARQSTDGWKLVPLVPNQEQKSAGGRIAGWDVAHECYVQMVEKAPAPPTAAKPNKILEGLQDVLDGNVEVITFASVPEDKTVGGKTIAEWREFARRDDCFDHMVPSDLRQILGLIKTHSAPKASS